MKNDDENDDENDDKNVNQNDINDKHNKNSIDEDNDVNEDIDNNEDDEQDNDEQGGDNQDDDDEDNEQDDEQDNEQDHDNQCVEKNKKCDDCESSKDNDDESDSNNDENIKKRKIFVNETSKEKAHANKKIINKEPKGYTFNLFVKYESDKYGVMETFVRHFFKEQRYKEDYDDYSMIENFYKGTNYDKEEYRTLINTELEPFFLTDERPPLI